MHTSDENIFCRAAPDEILTSATPAPLVEDCVLLRISP